MFLSEPPETPETEARYADSVAVRDAVTFGRGPALT
jgi:hypothetical protein